MRRIFRIFVLFYFSILPLLSSNIQSLPQKYKKWLEEEVVYIITKNEREIFLQLQTDRERDIFIEAFWKQRDPIPETPENEFMIEHYRRLDYANKRFQFGKPGWKTDRGKIYIILGEPHHIDSYINNRDFKDVEIWFYQNEKLPGLPTAFNIVFYREDTSADFKLYSPLNDGPQALLLGHKDYYTGYEESYQKLAEINPTVASVSLSLIPGESFAPSGTPSMASEMLLANVQSFPQKLISDKYATEFLRYKDVVEVEYTTNYVESDYLLTTIKKDGIYFVHYFISPKRFTFHRYDEKFLARILLNGRVSDLKNNTIYQFEKEYNFNFNEAKIKEIGNKPIVISDLFPLVAGNYKFSLIMRNTVSKEFSSFEKEFTIPESSPFPNLDSLLITYASKPLYSDDKTLRPFQWGNIMMLPETEEIITRSENMGIFLQFSGLEKERSYRAIIDIIDADKNTAIKEIVRDLKGIEGSASLYEEISISDIPPSFYRVKISLKDYSGKEILSDSKNVQFTHLPAISRPLFYFKGIPDENSFIDYVIGNQMFNKGEYESAMRTLKNAYEKNNKNEDFAISYAKALTKLNRNEDVINILSPFSENPSAKYDTYFLLGEALRKTSKFDSAIKSYSSALSHYGHNIDLLNSLGECYWNIGDFKNAKFFWSKSLELNPEQKDIKKKLSELK